MSSDRRIHPTDVELFKGIPASYKERARILAAAALTASSPKGSPPNVGAYVTSQGNSSSGRLIIGRHDGAELTDILRRRLAKTIGAALDDEGIPYSRS